MQPLNRTELNVFNLIHKAYPNGKPNKSMVVSFLQKKLTLGTKKNMELYTLWFLNYREDGDYSKLETVNRDLYPVVDILKQIRDGKIDETDIPEMYYEEPISFCQNSRWDENVPCVGLDSTEVTLKMDRDVWEQQNMSGLHEEDLWKYYESSHGHDHYEEYEDEEFNYANFTDEILGYIKTIALSAKRDDIVRYIEGGVDVEGEKIVEYLEELIPKDKFDEIRQDWLYDVGYETSRVRSIATKEYYESEITYDVDSSGGVYTLEIPMDEFIEIVEKENPLHFAEFLDMEINPEVDLESAYYDEGYYSNGDFTEHTEGISEKLEKLVDEYSDGSLMEYHSGLMKLKKIIELTGIKHIRDSHRDGKYYESEDGRLSFYENGVDILGDTITFTYDSEKHKVSLDDFSNWAQNSVLSLRTESRKIIKSILRNIKG